MNGLELHLSTRILLYWYLFIFFSTEILSYLHFLERNYFLLGESLFWISLIASYKKEILQLVRSLNFQSKGLLIIFTFFILTFIQGFFSAPSTTDSMVYHIPRVMYWIQEKTLIQDVIRNPHDFMAPFGEYILLHLYFISGSDRLLFLSQWIAYVVSVILSGVIAEQLGADKKTKILTSLFAATIPIAVMQAASTQIDMIVSVLVMMGTHIALHLLKRFDIRNIILFGLTMGLGLSTKATFVIYLIIPAGIVALAMIKNHFKNTLTICLAGLIALIIPLRFLIQNLNLYGNILGPFQKSGETLTNDIVSTGSLISNLIRNLMIHIPVPFFNHQTQNFIDTLHEMIGVQINSPLTTCCDFAFKVLPILYPQEDIMGNTIHLLIILITLFFLFNKKIVKNWLIIYTYILSVLSFVIFSLILKWQPFHSRLQIPFFMMGTVFSIMVLSRFKKGSFILTMILILSVPLALLTILLNVSRPYISYSYFYDAVKSFKPPLASIPQAFYIKDRNQQYFNARYYWYDPYNKVVNILSEKKPSTSKINFNLMDGFEYPLWLFLKEYNLNYHIVSESKVSDDTIIISTSNNPPLHRGYTTECVKTEIEYGYACISVKNVNILKK